MKTAVIFLLLMGFAPFSFAKNLSPHCGFWLGSDFRSALSDRLSQSLKGERKSASFSTYEYRQLAFLATLTLDPMNYRNPVMRKFWDGAIDNLKSAQALQVAAVLVSPSEQATTMDDLLDFSSAKAAVQSLRGGARIFARTLRFFAAEEMGLFSTDRGIDLEPYARPNNEEKIREASIRAAELARKWGKTDPESYRYQNYLYPIRKSSVI